MEVEIAIKDEKGDIIEEEEKKNQLLKEIYTTFKNSLWERTSKGYRVFI
ncbi:MAG: hypothetical protein ACP5D2_00940 [Candidatus Nanoarchaeia archaeon]